MAANVPLGICAVAERRRRRVCAVAGRGRRRRRVGTSSRVAV
jgi:hypothetical protein